MGVDTDPAELGPTHLIGIGGAGMSAVARLLLAHGVSVSGSDAQESRGLAALRERGARISIGQAAENIADARTVVVSTAIRETNPELAAAREAGLRVLHRSQALGVAMHGSQVVAVAGTHGKTTTSSMAAVALQECGQEPSWAIGAHVADLGTNAHLGRGRWFVAEADESDGSFLSYAPTIAVVTNIEPDHLDHYGSEEAFFQAFEDFADTLRPGGTLVACQDDSGSRRLAEAVRRRGGSVVTYGTDASAQIRVSEIRTEGIGATAELSLGEGADLRSHRMRLEVPGEHNVLNAAAAFAVTQIVGVPAEDALRGLAGFHGSDRRFDLKGEARGVRVIDDYAHHPTEVRAALTAARRVAGVDRVLVLFQPHLFSRTQAFAGEFAQALEIADDAWVLPIYAAREDPVEGVSSDLIADAAGDSVRSAFDPQEAIAQIAARAREGDLVLTVGAGDVTAFGPRLLSALEDSGQAGASA
ncbi:UDP-N-acetylmuramate--L-alanine ligase [Kocuria palustris]|nr:UDP-N-acetylmuramate--L-alanine ligase [Kocuria palustris]MBN6753300.1 UDP-N-acetylmuramate--L-alanine ligase [Kocuria palustris]MBN6758185.1 UDP-N-acetylmuramate--L-alanine ligase [Kocuria palustris]MBN6763213.1 UDP-N-acetylmuramate--L-alanine ligase [Kocuria palustris]MBN6782805.1 UDP-N-acetylmuramate--L-alanine ligase [Kocuria palustris]MBN6798942.1 UDP-N-acetylmuramate--L-alanine ligase [Kocuria palustris]